MTRTTTIKTPRLGNTHWEQEEAGTSDWCTAIILICVLSNKMFVRSTLVWDFSSFTCRRNRNLSFMCKFWHTRKHHVHLLEFVLISNGLDFYWTLEYNLSRFQVSEKGTRLLTQRMCFLFNFTTTQIKRISLSAPL